MPAVVRVKRRIDEEPLGAFVLNGKKRRIDENSKETDNLFETKDEISTILKFAGTVKSQDEKATKQFARLTKDEAKELAKKHRQPAANATERARNEMRTHGHENRFKVVNCFRTIDTDAEESTPKEITIVDIEKQATSTGTTSDGDTPSASTSHQTDTQHAYVNYTPTDSDGYVYDLYLPENEQQADNVDYTDNYLRIAAFDDLVYEDRYNNESESEDSEDSNDENYFRNDYPDEEDGDESVGEADMRRAINGLDLGSDEDEDEYDDEDQSSVYSCEPYYEDFIHSVETQDDSFDVDIDCYNGERVGSAYNRYMSKIRKSKSNGSDSSNSQPSSDEEST